jgi:hypothetical protein
MGENDQTADWLANDALFFSELEKGHEFSVEVARRLRMLGIEATVPPISKRIHVDDRDLYDNEADIIIPGTPEYVIEVKSRDLWFECAHDFPYETIFVDTVRGWEQKNPRPIAVAMISRQTLGIAVVRGSTRQFWATEQAFDHVRKLSDIFYVMPREHLVGFGQLVSFLRQRGRLIGAIS